MQLSVIIRKGAYWHLNKLSPSEIWIPVCEDHHWLRYLLNKLPLSKGFFSFSEYCILHIINQHQILLACLLKTNIASGEDDPEEEDSCEEELTGFSSSVPRPGKKTRGRVKVKMEFIRSKLRRYTTFSKRKTGIMKKAYELATLTGKSDNAVLLYFLNIFSNVLCQGPR